MSVQVGDVTLAAQKNATKNKKRNQENKTLQKKCRHLKSERLGSDDQRPPGSQVGVVTGRSTTNLRHGFNRGGNDANHFESCGIGCRFGDGARCPDGVRPGQKSAYPDAVELSVDA